MSCLMTFNILIFHRISHQHDHPQTNEKVFKTFMSNSKNLSLHENIKKKCLCSAHKNNNNAT